MSIKMQCAHAGPIIRKAGTPLFWDGGRFGAGGTGRADIGGLSGVVLFSAVYVFSGE